MPDQAGEFLKSEKEVPVNVQALTPRDFIIKLYVYRYEDAVQNLKVSKSNQINFKQELFDSIYQLYYSFVIPRIGIEAMKGCPNIDNMKEVEDARRMLEFIGKVMYQLGINKPEKEQSDLDHVIMEEMEFRQG